jgi:di/tricarboxylate transporter
VADSTIVFLVLAGVVVLFVTDLVPVEVVAIGTALALWATDVLDLDEALAGFGDPTVLFIASLFVVSESLDATGITTWAGQRLVTMAGTSRTRLLVLTMGLCALLTAVISVNGAVAALLPVVAVTAIRVGMAPSKLMLPLAFGAHAGSMLALTGTPVNVIASNAVVDAGGDPFGYFEFTLAGVPLLIGTVLVIVLFGERLLPTRQPRRSSPDFSTHARTLVDQYHLERGSEEPRFDRRSGLAEVVIPPRSAVVGDIAYPGMVTESGDLVVVAIQRKGEALGPGEVALAVGDTLLLRGDWEALVSRTEDPDLLVVDDPDAVRRQAVPLGPGSRRAAVILGAMVLLLATGAVPAAVAGLLAAGALVVTRVLTTEQAFRGISWTTVVLVAGMIPLSTAMTVSGAAGQMADRLVEIVGDAGPTALLVGLFVLTTVLGQLISNTATALIVMPIAVAAATDLDVSVRPVLMSVAIASAAAVLTPVATPANMMVMGPGGYRFGDYARLGFPVLVWFFVVSVGLVPLIWQF